MKVRNKQAELESPDESALGFVFAASKIKLKKYGL